MSGSRFSRTARRWLVFATALVVMVAAAAGTAAALNVGGSTPSLPQLQPPSQLPSTPNVSVPAPSAPSVPQVSTPQVSTPQVSTPQVSTPSAPSVSAPHVSPGTAGVGSSPGSGSSRSGAAGGGSGSSGGSGAGGSAGAGSSQGGASAAARRAAQTPQQRQQIQLHRVARDRRLRTEVTQLRGCLGAVPGIGRRVLTMRAGLNGAPQSRAATASALGISVSHEARIERGALRSLRAAAVTGCGGGGGGGFTATGAAPAAGGRASGVPALQPTAFLVSSNQPLLAPASLRSGHQQVEGAHSSSGAQQPSGRARLVTATTSGDLGSAWTANSLLIVLIVCGAGLAALAATGVRRFALASRTARPEPAPFLMMPAPPAAPMRPADPQPEPTPPQAPTEPPPPPLPPAAETRTTPQPPAPAAEHHRARTATMVASGIATFALRRLMKRRKRR